jgi:hypothetical protein
MKTKREQGKTLEEYVAQKLRSVLADDSIRSTTASGAATQLGDILCKYFLVECKQRSTESITIKEDVWNKLCAELPIDSKRVPMYVLENINKKRWVVFDFEDFCRILKKVQNDL